MPFEPTFDSDDNDVVSQGLIDRMVRVRWIAGTAIVTPRELLSHLTPHGKQRIDKLADLLVKAFPDAPPSVPPPPLKQRSVTVWIAAISKMLELSVAMSPIVQELMPPEFSIAENDSLLGLLAVYARTKVGLPPAIPPERS